MNSPSIIVVATTFASEPIVRFHERIRYHGTETGDVVFAIPRKFVPRSTRDARSSAPPLLLEACLGTATPVEVPATSTTRKRFARLDSAHRSLLLRSRGGRYTLERQSRKLYESRGQLGISFGGYVSFREQRRKIGLFPPEESFEDFFRSFRRARERITRLRATSIDVFVERVQFRRERSRMVV